MHWKLPFLFILIGHNCNNDVHFFRRGATEAFRRFYNTRLPALLDFTVLPQPKNEPSLILSKLLNFIQKKKLIFIL
jgi:hypothetical protein